MPEKKPTTIVTGTVDGFNRPKEWKDYGRGNVKRCGIKLKGAKAEWVNYWWNEKSKNGDILPDPYSLLSVGRKYHFVCETSEYQGKTQYDVKSYEAVMDEPLPMDEAEPIEENYPDSRAGDEIKEGVITEIRDGKFIVAMPDGSVIVARV